MDMTLKCGTIWWFQVQYQFHTHILIYIYVCMYIYGVNLQTHGQWWQGFSEQFGLGCHFLGCPLHPRPMTMEFCSPVDLPWLQLVFLLDPAWLGAWAWHGYAQHGGSLTYWCRFGLSLEPLSHVAVISSRLQNRCLKFWLLISTHILRDRLILGEFL
jgi:hypothetical protein